MYSMRGARCALWVLLAGMLGGALPALGQDTLAANHATPEYRLQPGDILEVSVWKEQDLQKEVAIRPDGGFTFPLAGNIDARGQSVENVRATLTERLQKYIPTPV